MTPVELAAIAARAERQYLAPCPMGCGCVYLDDADRNDCACDGPCCTDEWDVDTECLWRPELNERYRDTAALLAVLRERDNTIARVQAVLDSREYANFIPHLRAALDPQETE